MSKKNFQYTGKQSTYYTVEIEADTREEADKIYNEMGSDDMNEIGELEWEIIDVVEND